MTFARLRHPRQRIPGNLVIAVGYLKKLLDNAAVVKFLSRKDRDVLHQFQQIADTTSLDEG